MVSQFSSSIEFLDGSLTLLVLLEDDWKRDEYRAEERFDDARYDIDTEARRAGNWVEDAPEQLAYDAGQDVQRVEE